MCGIGAVERPSCAACRSGAVKDAEEREDRGRAPERNEMHQRSIRQAMLLLSLTACTRCAHQRCSTEDLPAVRRESYATIFNSRLCRIAPSARDKP